MTTTISAAAKAAQDAARCSNGQFGEQPRAEPTLTLFFDPEPEPAPPAPPVPETPPKPACTTEQGQKIYEARRFFMQLTPREAYTLAELGWTADVCTTDPLCFGNPRGLAAFRVTPERLAVINSGRRGYSYEQSKVALATAPLDDVAAIMSAGPGGVDEADVIELVDPAFAARVRQAREYGIDALRVVNSTVDLDTFRGLQQAWPKQQAGVILDMLENGHDLESSKAYGVALSTSMRRSALDARCAEVGIEPQRLRVLVGSSTSVGPSDVEDAVRLHRRGFASRRQYNMFVSACKTSDVDAALAYKLKPDTLAAFRKSARRGSLTERDIRAVKRLVDSGYDTPEKAAVLTTAVVPEAKVLIDSEARVAGVLPVLGSLARSGATPERITAMTRAGIPPHRLSAHANVEDLWAAGAGYRAEYQGKTGRPWPYDQE